MATEPKDESAAEEREEEQAETAEQPKEDSGVTVSEEFQQKAHQLLHKASKHEVRHIHDRAYAREEELRKEEEKESKKKGPKMPKDAPETYSDEGMPE